MAVGKILFSAVCLSVFIYGTIDVLTTFEQNKCQMTYMFEMPEYLKIPLSQQLMTRFPKYGLYVYGEGPYAKQVGSLKFSGVPVLFIPGNSGSHKQVRSLGSVALRRAMDKGIKYHFDYFSIDFNEELSALFGGVLRTETEFVHVCVKKILRLYKSSSNPPTSVIVVGHSMGGMLARALFTLPDFDHSMVNTIITQATPHQAPSINIDGTIAQFYKEVNQYWRKHGGTKLGHVTVVSTGGGHRDVQVRNRLASLNGIVDPKRGLSTSTMSVPHAWVSTDHLCAVWCKQMVLVTKRAMFDIVDPETKQVSTDVNHRMAVFRHHFLSHSGTRTFVKTWKEELDLDADGVWIVQENKVWEFAQQQVQQVHYIAVPLNKEGMDAFVGISNALNRDWICACKLKKGETKCKKCRNLSSKGSSIPPQDSGRKTVNLNLLELKDVTHIVLIVQKTLQKVEVMGDLHRQEERHLMYRLPGFTDMLMTYPESITQGTSVLTLFNDTLFYNLHLVNLDTVLKAFVVQLEPRKCSTGYTDLHEGSMMVFNVPWSNEDTYSFNRLSSVGNMTLKLQAGVPGEPSQLGEDNNVHLQLYLDPSCTYLLKIIGSPKQMLGQLIRFYGPLLPTFFVVILLMSIFYQLTCISTDGCCPTLSDSIDTGAKPYKIVPVAMLLNFLMHFNFVTKFTKGIDLLRTDIDLLSSDDLMFGTLPLLLYIITLGMVQFHCFLVHTAMTAISSILTFLCRCCPSPLIHLGKPLETVLLVLALILSTTVCGTIGILICYILCVVKVLRTSYLSRATVDEDAKSRYNFYLSILLLMMWTTILNFPSLVVWAKDLKYSFRLVEDPSRLVAICCVLAVTAILICDSPLSVRKPYSVVRWVVYSCNILLILFAMVSMYRIPYITVLAMVAIAIPQVMYKLQQRADKAKKAL